MMHPRSLPCLILAAAISAGCSDGGDAGAGSFTCADVTCDVNATCNDTTGTPLCTCNVGFEGTREVCRDIDECALGTHDCLEFCVNAPGSYTCETPRTCADIRDATLAGDPGVIVADAAYVVYLGGDPATPLSVYCHDMAGTPTEYLSLARTGADENFSRYTATPDGRTGKSIHTRYKRVRIDLSNIDDLAIVATDATFTDTTGSVTYAGEQVTTMPFGAAMSCDRHADARANIDVTGMPLEIVSEFCAGGFGPIADIPAQGPYRSVDLTARGGCGWVRSDDACASNPLDPSAPSRISLAYTQTDSQRFVFVTSAPVASDFGGLEAADAICQAHADAAQPAPLPGTYKAWLGSPDGHPWDRFIHYQLPYVLVDGTVVADNWSDLTDGTLEHAIDLDQNGNRPTGDTFDCASRQDGAVFTGTGTSGQSQIAEWSCTNWTGTGQRIAVGHFDKRTRGWTSACSIQADGDICAGQSGHLYCFEQ